MEEIRVFNFEPDTWCEEENTIELILLQKQK